MNPRELILLSPYRLPAQNAAMFSIEDVASFLNGYAALWHPAALRGATAPPRIGSPYDFEQPAAGHLYAVPENPPLLLPDDWDQRVREAGAVAFRAGPDREQTLLNLRDALLVAGGAPPGEATVPDLWSLPAEQVRPFFGIGFGYINIEALFEAMEHENLLASTDLWQDMQKAVAALGGPDADEWRRHLQSAADRLLAAREVLYPVTIHLLDFCLLDEPHLGEPLPGSFDRGLPFNLIASASLLERLGHDHPDRLAALRERIPSDLAEVCGGPYVEREDALLPVESQLWNLVKGVATYHALLGQEIRVFARKRFAAHPQLPLLLNSVGINRALLVAFDDSVIPAHRATVISWPSPDGKQVEAFTRTPYASDNPQTFFHVAHYLHKTIMQDHAATFALLHRGGMPAASGYQDWLELSRFGPVLGQWTTLSRYLGEVLAGEYTSAASADEFHGDYLTEAIDAHVADPTSSFARHARWRRRIDTAWTLAALLRGLAGSNDSLRLEAALAELEDKVETAGRASVDAAGLSEELTKVQDEAAGALAQRLLARAAADTPGYLVLNPCSFIRRVALELDGIPAPLPVVGPVKACQIDGDKARLVVEVPALGFAWFPATATSPAPAPTRMRLASHSGNRVPAIVRNEFFEAEIDPETGGLRALRDHRTRINRLGQQLVYNPGSVTRVKEIRVTSSGPALGEVISEGAILDEHDQVLATFRQRFRAWLGRPVLDLRIEIYPERPPEGYPWHAYYGARFAWRDERATLLRGVNGTSYVTSHTRPETPDFLELRLGKQCTTLFPGGLPFHQRHGARMLDVILLPEGETARAFDLAIGLDREHPMQTALGMVTPVPVVATTKGPPHVGATGWLFHLDASNLVLHSLRPGSDGSDSVTARMLECSSYGGQAELRCVRNPCRAHLLDARGSNLLEVSTQGDGVLFEVSPGDLAQLRVEFQ